MFGAKHEFTCINVSIRVYYLTTAVEHAALEFAAVNVTRCLHSHDAELHGTIFKETSKLITIGKFDAATFPQALCIESAGVDIAVIVSQCSFGALAFNELAYVA